MSTAHTARRDEEEGWREEKRKELDDDRSGGEHRARKYCTISREQQE
jgi:hypothetical protein